jgi:hypothetical protein
VAEVLHLSPTPLHSDVSPAAVARTPVWRLLDHVDCVESFFALAVHAFDDWTTGGVGAASAHGFDLGSRMGATHATLAALVHGAGPSSAAVARGCAGSGLASPRDVWAAWAAAADDRVGMDGELPKRQPLAAPPPAASAQSKAPATAQAQAPKARPPPALASGLASLGRFVTGAGSESPPPPRTSPKEAKPEEKNAGESVEF